MEKTSATNFQTPCQKAKKKGHLTPILIPPSPCMKKLGFGTGVEIYLLERFSPLRGCYKSPWAVKKIPSKSKKDLNGIQKRLEDETQILRTLKHPNIIGFRYQGKSVDDTPCLVMESGEKSLSDILEKREQDQSGPVPAHHILKVAECIASALDYLHRECRILHGDLKSPNVLVKGDFVSIKLCDFGVTLKLDDNMCGENNNYIGTECWSAPEVLLGERLSNKTDMFSFGLLLWEMISLCGPHLDHLSVDSDILDGSDMEAAGQVESRNEEAYMKAIGTRPPLPEVDLDSSYNKVLEIFFLCTEKNMESRFSAQQVLEHFFTTQK